MKMSDLLQMMKEHGSDGESEMDPKEIRAKMDVLQELLDMALEKEGHGVHGGMEKLSIMAKDKEGLKKGLGAAEGLMDKMPEALEEDSPEEEASESPEEERAEEPHGEEDEDKELEDLKKKKSSSKFY